jgi:hypothetical protein
MGRTRQPGPSAGVSASKISTPEQSQDKFTANLNEARVAAEPFAAETGALRQDYEARYQLLCSERAALQFDLQKARKRLDMLELERDVKTRLVQQQAAEITRMRRELAERNTDAELVQKLLQSASWRVTAPLRAAKLILTRVMPNKR